jgi:TolB-like protein/DNA-binding winged helix-turn-helix (wHTH) protein/Tfp pilus assembly protein PilF
MERAERGREVFQVGDLVVDVGLQRVASPAGDITLPKLSFDLLLALVRRAPDYVSNEDLASIVWAGVVVSPETVTKRVNLLREALGDDSAQPRYVAGLRSRGYRVVAPVARVAADAAPVHADDAPTPAADAQSVGSSDPTRVRTPTRRLAMALALILALAAGWFVLRDRETTASVTPVAEPADAAATVAVLPFENLSASADDAYLATGVPEMVQDRLALVPGLTVIAGGSAAGVANGADPKETGHLLGARFLVLGSAQRLGDQLRIGARLVDTQSGAIVWSTRIDRPVSDLFAVQDSISASVTEELRQRLNGISPPPDLARHTPPVEALFAYLRGRAVLSRHTVRGAEQAAAEFERAIQLDQEFASAMAGLYDARMLVAERRHDDLEATRAAQAPLIDRALATDPNCGPAYVARAIWTRGDDTRQEADFERGLALDPVNGRGLVAYSEFLDQRGRYDEGSKVLDRAQLVDPLSPRLQFRLVMREFGRSKLQTREPGLQRVLELDPDYQPALQRYGKTLWLARGDSTEAAQVLEHAIEVDPENPWSRHTAAAIYLDLGNEPAARQVAAGTPSSARTTQLLLALYDGDWRTAGEVAYSRAGSEYNLAESWGAAEAVRDHALRSGDLRRGIEFLEKRYQLGGEEPKLEITNFRAAAFLAQLLAAEGETERAQALLARLPAAIDASFPRFGTVFALRTRATVELLTGDHDAALETLQRSFADGDFTQWWYTLDHDRTWTPLRDDPRFEAIDAQVRARVAQETAQLAELRREGRIIDRDRPPADASP